MKTNIINIKDIDNDFEMKMKSAFALENLECHVSLNSKSVIFNGDGDIVSRVKRIIEENGYIVL